MARQLLVLTAGLGTPSTTRLLADRLAKSTERDITARGEAVETTVLELRELAVELGRAFAAGGVPTPELTRARELVSAADGIIAVTPVFAAGVSGLFKMFVDLLDPGAVEGTPVLLAATAGTPRHSLVIEHAMRPLFAYLRAVVVPTGVFAATEDFGGDGGRDLDARIRRASGQLAALMVAERGAVEGFAASPEDERARRTRRAGTHVDEEAVTPFARLLEGHAGRG